MTDMKTTSEYLRILRAQQAKLQRDFGVVSLCLFGSVARGQQQESSDVDICVEMAPNPFARMEMKRYLEGLMECPVDVVRRHRGMNDNLVRQIQKEGIDVF